jgi:hypothetical protein
MPLTMRPTRLGAGIDKDRQDFTIYSSDGQSAGSMRRAVVPITLRWFWSFTITCPMTRCDKVATLEEAKVQFRKSWDAWKAWVELREDT